MTTGPKNRAQEAFFRLLSDAGKGGQAKVDALVALSQRTVFVVPWTHGVEGFRTITNSDGHSALPVFTSIGTLEATAQRLAWAGPDGAISSREVGARESFHYALAHSVSFLIVDMDEDHAMEIVRSELETMMTPEARRESTGPFAGVGRISSTMMKAVTEGTPPPTNITPSQLGASAPAAPERPGNSSAPPPSGDVSANFGSGSAVALSALSSAPGDDLLAALAAGLREYPEVEWAAIASVARGPAAAVPTVCLRVDTGYRARVGEIMSRVRSEGERQGATLDVMLLDDSEVMRMARGSGLAFYPWRRR